jgi:hypothetical protein
LIKSAVIKHSRIFSFVFGSLDEFFKFFNIIEKIIYKIQKLFLNLFRVKVTHQLVLIISIIVALSFCKVTMTFYARKESIPFQTYPNARD